MLRRIYISGCGLSAHVICDVYTRRIYAIFEPFCYLIFTVCFFIKHFLFAFCRSFALPPRSIARASLFFFVTPLRSRCRRVSATTACAFTLPHFVLHIAYVRSFIGPQPFTAVWGDQLICAIEYTFELTPVLPFSSPLFACPIQTHFICTTLGQPFHKWKRVNRCALKFGYSKTRIHVRQSEGCGTFF